MSITKKCVFKEKSRCGALRAEELLLKHEDDELVLTIVLSENLHIH
jgi:hypothetical protein